MSTRGVIGLVVGKKKFGIYNHFDSYPDGLGDEVVNFISGLTPTRLKKFKNNVKALTCVKKDPSEAEKKYYSDYADLSVSEQSLDDWYCLLHSFQGSDGLDYIARGVCKHIDNAWSEIKSKGSWTEWAYVLDLDNKTMEVYDSQKKAGKVPFKNIHRHWKKLKNKLNSDEEDDDLG